MVRIGQNSSAKVEHAAIAQPKTTVGLGFSFGTPSIKNFSITPWHPATAGYFFSPINSPTFASIAEPQMS